MTAAPRLRRLLLALVLCAAFAAVPGLGHAQDPNDVNSAVAVNEKDGSSVFDFAFSVRRVAGEVVDQQNVAVAYASCESCQAIAIAVQVVIVTGNPDVVTPQNVAVAVNENCTLCTSVALAYQFVFGGSQQLRLTGKGWREIAQIRREFLRLRKSGLTPDEIRLRADELASRLRTVMQTELKPYGPDDDEDEEDLEGDFESDEFGEDAEQDDDGRYEEQPPASTTTTTTPDSTTTTTTPSEPQPGTGGGTITTQEGTTQP